MRKIKLLLISIIVFVLNITIVNAAPAASISVSRSSIENGSSVTATVKVSGVAAWNIKITSSGSTSGCNNSFADVTSNGANTTKSFSVTCKATSVGKINFSYSGDITASDGTSINVSGAKSVTVTTVREKSSDADLSSLRVEGFEITPSFSKNVLEYSLTVDSTVERINVIAGKSSSSSSITNAGVNNVTEGENKINIVVTAENGEQKTYVINVAVKELNPIIVNLDDKEYIVVKKLATLDKPPTYEESVAVVKETEVPAFYSEATKFTLIGLKDEKGNIGLYIYDEDTNSYNAYHEIKFSNIIFYSIDGKEHMPSGYNECDVSINGIKTIGYCKTNVADFVLLYGMNVETGNIGHYVYDKLEHTLQRNNEEREEINEDNRNYFGVIILSVLSTMVIFGVGYYILKNKKVVKKKNSTKKR